MWLPITEFFIWLVIIDVYARKAIRMQEEFTRLEGIEKGEAYGLYPPRDPDLPQEQPQHGGTRSPVTELPTFAPATSRTH